MKTTIDKNVFNSQQAKDVVAKKAKEFIEFIAKCLDDDDFVVAINDLLPFDKCVQSKMEMENNTSIVKSMGLSIMRMEIDPPLFSLGVSLDFAETEEKKAICLTTFITACRTLEDLRNSVKSDAFLMQVRNSCEKQIDVFSSQSHDRKDGVCDSY